MVSVTPWPLFTPAKTRYPLYRRLDGFQGRSGQVGKISPPPGFDPWTVQPVASRYTDYATQPLIRSGFMLFMPISKKQIRALSGAGDSFRIRDFLFDD